MVAEAIERHSGKDSLVYEETQYQDISSSGIALSFPRFT